jgi:hypothetical protein
MANNQHLPVFSFILLHPDPSFLGRLLGCFGSLCVLAAGSLVAEFYPSAFLLGVKLEGGTPKRKTLPHPQKEKHIVLPRSHYILSLYAAFPLSSFQRF